MQLQITLSEEEEKALEPVLETYRAVEPNATAESYLTKFLEDTMQTWIDADNAKRVAQFNELSEEKKAQILEILNQQTSLE